jgi:hypothetical protein
MQSSGNPRLDTLRADGQKSGRVTAIIRSGCEKHQRYRAAILPLFLSSPVTALSAVSPGSNRIPTIPSGARVESLAALGSARSCVKTPRGAKATIGAEAHEFKLLT